MRSWKRRSCFKVLFQQPDCSWSVVFRVRCRRSHSHVILALEWLRIRTQYDWRQRWSRDDKPTDAMGSRSTSSSSSISVTQGGAWVSQVFFWLEFRVQHISGDYSDDDNDDDDDGKINLSLCLIMNTRGDAFLTRTLEGSAQISSYDHTPGRPTHLTGVWVGLKVGLDDATMRIIPPTANRTAVFQTAVSHSTKWDIDGDNVLPSMLFNDVVNL
jgi:hypothetical protein